MPTPSSGRDSSRRSSKSGPSGNDAYKRNGSDRREKAKSSQVYEGSKRRGSRQAESGLDSVNEQRPGLKSRTNSAPLLEPQSRYDVAAARGQTSVRATAPSTPVASGEDVGTAQDEDEVAGVVGAVRHFQPFQNPEVGAPTRAVLQRQEG